MNPLCGLGIHRPADLPRWNGGFYFTRCTRCGSDLVRTAFERWHVPQGYKVVWSAQPPEPIEEVSVVRDPPPRGKEAPVPLPPPVSDAPAASRAHPDAPAVATDAEPAAAADVEATEQPTGGAEDLGVVLPADESPGSGPLSPQERASENGSGPEAVEEAPAGRTARLPIEEVLEHAREFAIAPEPPPLPPPPPPPPRRGRHWDFMDEEQPRPAGAESAAVQTTAAAQHGGPPSSDPPPAPGPQGASATASEQRHEPLRARLRQLLERHRSAVAGGAIALAFVLLALVILLRPGSDHPAAASGPTPSAATSAQPPAPATVPTGTEARALQPRPGVIAAQGSIAYIVAELLQCRSAPSRQGERLRSLERGSKVEVLASEGEWLSIGHKGRQCWVQARFVSPLPPY